MSTEQHTKGVVMEHLTTERSSTYQSVIANVNALLMLLDSQIVMIIRSRKKGASYIRCQQIFLSRLTRLLKLTKIKVPLSPTWSASESKPAACIFAFLYMCRKNLVLAASTAIFLAQGEESTSLLLHPQLLSTNLPSAGWEGGQPY